MTSSLENSGLSKNDISSMQKVLQSFPEIKQCLLFASRAKGTLEPLPALKDEDSSGTRGR
jgi:hypothetical protein